MVRANSSVIVPLKVLEVAIRNRMFEQIHKRLHIALLFLLPIRGIGAFFTPTRKIVDQAKLCPLHAFPVKQSLLCVLFNPGFRTRDRVNKIVLCLLV